MEHSVLAPEFFELPTGRIDIWHARPTDYFGDFQRLSSLLSAEERDRMSRLVRAADRRSYAVGRGLLRCLLGGYLGYDAVDVEIVAAPSSKPKVHGPIAFNVSHSEDRLLFGMAREMPVGVDIQVIDPALQWRDFSADVFSPNEEAPALVADAEAGLLAFFHCWTLKEAVTKMDGDGLSRPFGSFSAPSIADPDIRWGRLDVGPGFAAAWAMRTREPVDVIERTITRLQLD